MNSKIDRVLNVILLGLLLPLLISVIILPILYLGICLTNETMNSGNSISYCQIANAGIPLDHPDNMLISSEYKLIGIKRWRFTNTVLGIYPSAKSALDAAHNMNCPVDK